MANNNKWNPNELNSVYYANNYPAAENTPGENHARVYAMFAVSILFAYMLSNGLQYFYEPFMNLFRAQDTAVSELLPNYAMRVLSIVIHVLVALLFAGLAQRKGAEKLKFVLVMLVCSNVLAELISAVLSMVILLVGSAAQVGPSILYSIMRIANFVGALFAIGFAVLFWKKLAKK